MLILRRNVGEAIVIAGTVTVWIYGIEEGRRVKIGIDAPTDIVIVREELLEQKEGTNGTDQQTH